MHALIINITKALIVLMGAILIILIFKFKNKKSEVIDYFNIKRLSKIFGTSFSTVIILIGILYGFESFIDQELYKIKETAYTRALEIINQHILAMDIALDRTSSSSPLYLGTTCGKEPSQQEKNDTYSLLALTSYNPEIPQLYLQILLPSTSTSSPVKQRDDFINVIRQDLNFNKRIDLNKINGGNSLIVSSSCISTPTTK